MNRRIIASFLSVLMLISNVYAIPRVKETSGDNLPAAVKESQWKGKKVAFLGDSITDKKRIGTDKCYWEYLAEMLGFTPYVYGINGNQWNKILDQAKKLYEERGTDIDAIFIFAGTNDYNAGVVPGEWYTEGAEVTQVKNGNMETRRLRHFCMTDSTFKGRINRAMDYLKSHFPTKQIILMTPIHRAYAKFGEVNVQPAEVYANKLGIYVEEYVRIVKEAGNVWAVPVIDLNSISGLYPVNDAHAQYFHDGATDRLHPNALGHKRMATAIMYQMLAMPASFE